MNSKGNQSPYTHGYKPGDIVTVVRGPFWGQEGQVTAICYKTVEVGWPRAEPSCLPAWWVERLWFKPENIRLASICRWCRWLHDGCCCCCKRS